MSKLLLGNLAILLPSHSGIIEDTRGIWYIADVFALEPLAVSQENHFGHPEDSLAFVRSVGN